MNLPMKKRTFWVRSVTTKGGYHRVFWGVQPAEMLLRTEPFMTVLQSCTSAQQKRIFCRIRLTSGRSHLPVSTIRTEILQSDPDSSARNARCAVLLSKVAGLIDQVAVLVDQVAVLVDQVAVLIDQVAVPVDQVAVPVDQVAGPIDPTAVLVYPAGVPPNPALGLIHRI